MNKDRRKRLVKLAESIETIRLEVSMIMDEEQEAFDNLPEGLQESTTGENIEMAIENLDYAQNSIEEVISYINDACN